MKKMSNFWKALVFTVIPLFMLGVISTAGLALGNTNFSVVWVVDAVLFFPVFITGIVFIVIGKRQIGAGIIGGLGFGIVILGATCFANLIVAPK